VLTDESNNSCTYSEVVEVKLDFEKLVNEKYKNRPGDVYKHDFHSSTTGVDYYLEVIIDSEKSALLFNTSETIIYTQTTNTKFNKSGLSSLQIQTEHFEFDKAFGTYEIYTDSGSHSIFGFSFDATKNDNSIYISSFYSRNDGELDSQLVLIELNEQINTVVNSFNEFLKTVLN
jgi:hypothetical protein